MLLALVAIFGSILCISITIAIVKRQQRNLDDEAGLSPSRDIEAEIDNNRACALEQLTAFVLTGAAGEVNETGMNSLNEQRDKRSLLTHKQTNGHVHDHVDTMDVHLHGQRITGSHDNGTNRITVGVDNLALTDIDNENDDRLDGLRALTDAATVQRRSSQSGSILTSTKVIFVQDSSSSRSSTSSSSKSCD
jgi:hypothetical protein